MRWNDNCKKGVINRVLPYYHLIESKLSFNSDSQTIDELTVFYGE
jgi:hypothetical protein